MHEHLCAWDMSLTLLASSQHDSTWKRAQWQTRLHAFLIVEHDQRMQMLYTSLCSISLNKPEILVPYVHLKQCPQALHAWCRPTLATRTNSVTGAPEPVVLASIPPLQTAPFDLLSRLSGPPGRY